MCKKVRARGIYISLRPGAWCLLTLSKTPNCKANKKSLPVKLCITITFSLIERHSRVQFLPNPLGSIRSFLDKQHSRETV